MTVYEKKATIRFEDKDKKAPHRVIDVYTSTERFKGINYIILKNKSAYQNELDVQFVCSDVEPSFPRKMEDIDELLARLNVREELAHHKNDPVESGASLHRMDIFTNLDNPNIDDKLRSTAKDIHDEDVDEERVKSINEDFDRYNKGLSDTSTDNSDRLKPMDEKKTKFQIGEIERE